MTIQQHASFDSSAAELNATSKLVKAWESKNAKNAAKVGGVSLMALSLAACGGSSDTEVVDTTPVVETPVVEEPVVEEPVVEEPVVEEPVVVAPVVTELAVSALTADTTMKTTDDLDGGDGTADELSLSLSADFAGFVVDTDAADTGSMVGYETVSLAADTLARSFDATGVSGVVTYKIDGSNGGVVSIADSADLSALELSNIASGAFSITYAAPTGGTSPVAGTDDTLALTVEGLGSATADIAITAAGVETLAVTSNAAATAAGGANFLDTSGVAAAKLKVDGAGALDFGAVSTSTTSFDASEATGDITASLTKAGTDALATIKTGSGDDSITVNANDLVATGTVAMGDGDDTFTVSSTAAETLELTMSGAETMVVSGLGAATTLSLANTTDLGTFVAKDAAGASNYTAATTIVNASGAQNFDLEGSTKGSFTTDTAGAVDIDITAVATAALGSEDTVTTTFTAAKASSLDISVGNFTETTGAISAAKATSVTVVSGTNDQSGMVITAAKAETWNITSGDDADYTGSTMSGAKSVTVVSAGATELPTLAALNTATLSGAGADASIDITADIGAATLANDITITATGLLSGLDLDGTKADVGTIKSAGKVTIDAGGVTGTTTIGNITSTGAASVTTGAKAAMVGTIDASAVTLDVSNSASVTSVGQITTGSTATVISNSVTSMGTVDIAGDKTSLTATLTGSLGDDDYNLTNTVVAGFTGFTVSGDLGVGTDRIDIAVADATALASETPSQTIDITGVKNASVFINLADQTDTDTLVIKGSKETTVIDTLVITKAGEQLDDLTITDIDEITHDAATLKAASITGQTIEFNAGSANDVITLDGTGAADTISLANFANAAGNATNFTVNGGDKADTITGSDFIDILNGGAGGDTLNGGDGADTITGGAGNDTMSGGDDTAADKFTMAESGTASAATATSLTATLAADDTITFGDGVDIITDFTAGTDDLVATVAGSTSLVNMVGSQVVANAVTNDTNNVGYGTWNADDNVFTFAAAFNATSAKDALFVAGDGSLKLTDTTAFVVIDDLSAALVAGDIIV